MKKLVQLTLAVCAATLLLTACNGKPKAEQPKEKKAEGNVVDADFEVVDDGAKK